MITTARGPYDSRAEQNPAYRPVRHFSITYRRSRVCLTVLPNAESKYLSAALLRQFGAFLDAYAVVPLGARRVSIPVHPVLYVRRIAAILLQHKSSKLFTIVQTAFAAGTTLGARVGRKSQEIEGNKEGKL